MFKTSSNKTQATSGKLTRAQQKYVSLLGEDVCIQAFQMHEQGDGASTIGWKFDKHLFKATGKSPSNFTNYGDCLINAGRILQAQKSAASTASEPMFFVTIFNEDGTQNTVTCTRNEFAKVAWDNTLCERRYTVSNGNEQDNYHQSIMERIVNDGCVDYLLDCSNPIFGNEATIRS
jgi:hypothetical protein